MNKDIFKDEVTFSTNTAEIIGISTCKKYEDMMPFFKLIQRKSQT